MVFFQDIETSEAESRLRIDQVSERGWSETLNSISKADSSPDEVPEIVEEMEATPKNNVMSQSGRSHTQRYIYNYSIIKYEYLVC